MNLHRFHGNGSTLASAAGVTHVAGGVNASPLTGLIFAESSNLRAVGVQMFRRTHICTSLPIISRTRKTDIFKSSVYKVSMNSVLHGLCLQCLLKHHPHPDALGRETERDGEGGRDGEKERLMVLLTEIQLFSVAINYMKRP